MLQPGMGGTILLVEDEPIIGELLTVVLEEAGFIVELAQDADSALAALERSRALNLAGVVTDIKLSGSKSGWEIASHARAMNPALPVVYMSSDSAADWTARGVPRSAVLQKPFAVSQVAVAISALMSPRDLDG